MYVPVSFLPWLFFPSFWKGLKNIKQDCRMEWGMRFLLLWIVPAFTAFSLISEKQIHYLIPLLPGVLIMTAFWINEPLKKIIIVVLSVNCALFLYQAVASQTFFKRYDLSVVTDYLQTHKHQDLAVVRLDHGELNFLGRMEKPFDEESMSTIDDWFTAHPNGLAIIRYENHDQTKDYEMLFDMVYRSKRVGYF